MQTLPTSSNRETGNNAERAVDWVFSHPDDDGDDGADQGEPMSTVRVIYAVVRTAVKKLPDYLHEITAS